MRTYKSNGRKRGKPTAGTPLTDRQVQQLLESQVLDEEHMVKLLQEACRRASMKRVAATLGIAKATLWGVISRQCHSHVTEHIAEYMGYRRERMVAYRFVRRED